MLNKEITEAVESESFNIWSINNIDEGIGLLTDMEVGEQKEDGSYPEGTFNYFVRQKLSEFTKVMKAATKRPAKNNSKDETKETLNKNKGSLQSLRRFQIQIISLCVLFFFALEAYYFFIEKQPITKTLPDLIIGFTAALTLIWLGFRGAIRLQGQLDAELEKSQLQSRRQAALVKLSADLITTHDEIDICKRVVRGLHDTLGYDYLGLYLIEGSTKDRILAAITGWDDLSEISRISPGYGLSEKPIIDQSIHYSPDVRNETHYLPGLGSGAEVDIPLIINDKVVGVLVVESRLPHSFDQEDFNILMAASNQAALAITNARLLIAEKEQKRNAEILREATEALTSNLELERVLEKILFHLEQVVPYDSTCIFLLEGDQLNAVAERGLPEADKVIGHSFPASDKLFQQILTTSRPYIIKDVDCDPRFLGWGGTNDMHGWMGVPLVGRSEVIGYLTLDNRKIGAYGGNEADLAQAFANQAASAIENARLFREIQFLAMTDDLTGLYNRRHFLELANEEFVRAKRFGNSLSTIMVDPDYFKRINDKYGHAIGDEVIKTIATRSKDNIRSFDVIGRYGGDEFIIILPETGLAMAMNVAERLKACIAYEALLIENEEITLTISLGVATMDKNTPNLAALLNQVDQALYAAKQAGRNCVRYDGQQKTFFQEVYND